MLDVKALATQYLPKAIPYLVVGVLAFFLGWSAKPAQVRVEEKLRVETVEKEVLKVVEKEVIKFVRDTAVAERVHRETLETKTPDGTIVTRTTEDRNIDTVVHENAETVKVVEVEKEVVVIQEKIVERKIEPVLANYRIGPMVGIQPTILPSLSLGPVVYGASVERRIWGPIWGGAWGLSNGSFGLTAAFEF